MSRKREKAEPLIAGLPATTPATPAERGFALCPCPKAKCDLHGDCLPCVAYHSLKRAMPRCQT